MLKPNYSITPTRARSTADLGYHHLAEYAGPVPRHQAMGLPAPAGQTANFVQGVADSMPQRHHAFRSAVASFVVGVAVGDAVARMRHGRR